MIGNEVSAVEAITVTIFSMGLVFAVLFAINLILDVFKMQNERDQKIKAKKAAKEAPVKEEPVEIEKPKEDDSEIVAVITTALMANLKTSKDKLIIKSIRQIQDPTWAQTGRIENMN